MIVKSSQQPSVSIIIPLYNNEDHVADAISSALKQTWPKKEIIVVDDGSTDNSLAIANKFKSDQVKVFSQKNRGASAARNKGIRETNSEYVQFLDADDLLDSKKIENQIALIQGNPYALAYGPVGYFNNNESALMSEPISSLKEDFASGYDFLFALYGGNSKNSTGGMVPLHAWLTPKQLIAEAGYWDESLSVDDDGEFFCRVILKAGEIKYADNAIGYYRKHEHNQNLSAQKSLTAYMSVYKAIRLKHRHIGDDKKMNVLLANQAMHILNDMYPREPKLRRDIRQFIHQLGGNNWQPYQEGGHKFIRMLFGWRFVKLLSYYKNKILVDKKSPL